MARVRADLRAPDGCTRLTLSHSSHALPAPNPRPAHTGHDLRLNRRTENMTPKDAPRVLRIRRVLRQWSHYVRRSISSWYTKNTQMTRRSFWWPLKGETYLLVEQCLAHWPVCSARGRIEGVGCLRVGHDACCRCLCCPHDSNCCVLREGDGDCRRRVGSSKSSSSKLRARSWKLAGSIPPAENSMLHPPYQNPKFHGEMFRRLVLRTRQDGRRFKQRQTESWVAC